MSAVIGPPPLGSFPPGLLALLGIKSGGKNPNSLSDQLWPVIELRDWYFAQQFQKIQFSTANTAGVGGLVATTIPQNQWWWCRLLSGGCSALGAGTTVRYRLATFLNAAGSNAQCFGDLASGTTGERPTSNYVPSLLFPPGTSIGAFVESIVNGVPFPITVQMDQCILQA